MSCNFTLYNSCIKNSKKKCIGVKLSLVVRRMGKNLQDSKIIEVVIESLFKKKGAVRDHGAISE